MSSELESSYIDKLNEIKALFEDLTRQLIDPKVLSNPTAQIKIAKERSEHEETVELYETYTTLQAELRDADEMRQDDDPELKELGQEEWDMLKAQEGEIVEKLKALLRPKNPYEDRNLFLEIRAGTGGDEAALFVGDLMRMYTKYAELQAWKVEIMNSQETGLGGYREVVLSMSGKGAYRHLQYESGVHRVQRVPKTEASGRIHTSTVTVAVIVEAEEVDIEISTNDLRVDTYCASGPGGQGVNTTYSAVRITHMPTGVVVTCQDERSQIKNKAKAMRVLRSRILEAEMARQNAEMAEDRKSKVGTGGRSEKIRTFNFKENRVTDHRINLSLYQLEKILEGEIHPLIEALVTEGELLS